VEGQCRKDRITNGLLLTLIVVKGGKVVEQAIGARGKKDIAAMLERHL